MNIEKWIKENTASLKGKTVAITGSTGVLGGHICKYLAGLNANLILLDRNQTRSKAHKEKLEKIGDGSVTNIKVDMADFSSVKDACQKLSQENIDFLILNAGAYSLPRQKSSLGFDNVFQINFVSPYYMVNQIIDKLRERKGKVVVVGSIAHKFSKIKENDIDFSSVKAPRKVYGNAKRFLMFSLTELLKNEENVSLAIAHPGITPTNITSHYPKFIQKVVKYPMKMIFTSPKKASLNIVKGLFEECGQGHWIGPRVCGIWGKPKKVKLNSCKQEEREKIFQIAQNLYNELLKNYK